MLVLVKRILKSMLEILVWIDEGGGLIVTIPFFLVFGHPRPDAANTISSMVGFYAELGYKWALVAEWIIDRLFYVFNGFKLGHCREHIKWSEVDRFKTRHGGDDEGKS